MQKNIDTSSVQEGGTFELVEEGIHYARIAEVVENTSENGDDMPTVKLVMISGVSQDLWVWDNIVISDNQDSPGYKILGRSKHFLHCIGEPYEGQINVNTDNWLNKEVKIEVFHDTFTNKKGRKTTRAKVKNYLIDEDETEKEESPF